MFIVAYVFAIRNSEHNRAYKTTTPNAQSVLYVFFFCLFVTSTTGDVVNRVVNYLLLKIEGFKRDERVKLKNWLSTKRVGK